MRCLNNPMGHILSDPQKLHQALVASKPVSLFGGPFVTLTKGKELSTLPIMGVKHLGKPFMTCLLASAYTNYSKQNLRKLVFTFHNILLPQRMEIIGYLEAFSLK